MGSKYERSNDYRKKYIGKHKGFFGIYTCSYCGKLCSKSTMEVDHIYPINGVKTKTSGKLWVNINTWYLPSNNKGVNEPWNTAAACHDCNHAKSDLGGSWIIRGYIGRIIFPIINIWLIGGLSIGVLHSILKGDNSDMITYLVANVIFRLFSFAIRGRNLKLPNFFPFTNNKRWRR